MTAGQKLFDVYSPELNVLQQQWRLAGRSADAADKLRYLAYPEAAIEKLRRRAASRTVTIPSPVAGTVIDKIAIEGMRFQPGETLFRIVDTSTMWVMAEVYEQDLAFVKVGDAARVTVNAWPGEPLRGPGDVHLSQIGKESRTARLRIEVANPDGRLRADMAATVEITTPLDGNRLAVPESAVIDSGRRQVVLVERGEGRYEPRPVRLGARVPGWVQVLDGVKAGERVVTQATFLIDAESNIRAALAAFGQAEGRRRRQVIAGVIRWSARNLLLILIATAAIVGGGLFAVGRLSLDAIPDLSDTQVIVYTEMPGQAPQVVEDQVTYPLTTALLAVPRSRAVRGFSFFGVSFVYVIFEDGTDIYWARSRVLEYLNSGTRSCRPVSGRPLGRTRPASAGSISTSCWARTARSPSCARSRTGTSASASPRRPGVAEVASVGGFVRQYNVVVDPAKLRSYGVPLGRVDRRHPRLQPRDRRPRRRDGRGRVHGARPRLPQGCRRSRADRAQGRWAHAGADARRGARRAGA